MVHGVCLRHFPNDIVDLLISDTFFVCLLVHIAVSNQHKSLRFVLQPRPHRALRSTAPVDSDTPFIHFGVEMQEPRGNKKHGEFCGRYHWDYSFYKAKLQKERLTIIFSQP